MRTELFTFELPRHLIAQQPAVPRTHSRLLVLNSVDGSIEHRGFGDIAEYLRPGDLLVANDSRVIPARLRCRKATGGRVEILLLRQTDDAAERWECLVRGKKMREGSQVLLATCESEQVAATVAERGSSGKWIIQFSTPIVPLLAELGEIPLPPYITEYRGDPERYQTVYSRAEGSVAAPTAGLHFTPDLLCQLRHQGSRFETVTLHIGLDTFRPIKSEEVESHQIHTEWAALTQETARAINQTRESGGRVLAVGTTTVRTLEWAATAVQRTDPYGPDSRSGLKLASTSGFVDLYIRPGYRFRVVDMLVTNFHLPRSTLLVMVSAFVGRSHSGDVDLGRRILLNAYREAIGMEYRFYSFGDAMLVL